MSHNCKEIPCGREHNDCQHAIEDYDGNDLGGRSVRWHTRSLTCPAERAAPLLAAMLKAGISRERRLQVTSQYEQEPNRMAYLGGDMAGNRTVEVV